MTSVSTPEPLGDSKHGGALFILPREIRDEVYRFLVKRRYTVIYAPKPVFGTAYGAKITAVDMFDLAIFQISHAIGHEVQAVLYSESTFRYYIDFSMSMPRKLPTAVVNRMKNVEIVIRGLGVYYVYEYPTYKSRTELICEAIIDGFTGTRILRDVCHIRIPAFRPDMIEPLESYILPKLATFHGFRTLLVEITTELERIATARFERVIEGMKDAMEPTLGPATITNGGSTIRLEFHPREHVPSLFGAQAQKALLDTDRLQQCG